MVALYPLAKQYHPDFQLPGVKPVNPVKVDSESKYRPDHVWALQRSAIDLKGNANGTLENNSAGWFAKGFNCGARLNNIIIQQPGALDLWGGKNAVTIIALIDITNDSTRRFVFHDTFNVNDTRIRMEITTADKFNLSMRGAAGDTQLVVNSADSFSGRHCFVGIFDTVTGSVTGYAGGKEILSGSGTITTPFSNDSSMNTVIGAQGTGANNFNGKIEFFATLPYNVGVQGAISLSLDPYQIVEPAIPMQYFTPTGVAPSVILSPHYYTSLLSGQ